MAKRFWLSLSLAVLLAGSATAQDARSALQAAATAMGVNNMKSIQYTGTGWQGMVGQNVAPDQDWPRVDQKS
jgi:opacity protein-like surface antigen